MYSEFSSTSPTAKPKALGIEYGKHTLEWKTGISALAGSFCAEITD